MLTQHYDVQTETGRTVAVWRSAGGAEPSGGRVVVIAPGFGQRLRSSGALALMLARNGATVYRFDSLDHVGISDGEIRQFSVTALYESLSAVVDTACRAEQVESVSLVATSLAAVAAVQYAAREKRTDGVVLMLGVVSVRKTLHQVLGEDYTSWDYADLPEQVMIDKHWVDPRPIRREHDRVDWLEAESTVNALSVLNVPVRNYVAVDDDWVNVADVHEVFEAANLDPRTAVVEVALSGHALLRNPVALKAMMLDVTRAVIGRAPHEEIVVPSFEEVVAMRGEERGFEREHVAARVG